MSEWQPIATAPNDDDFRLYGLFVTNNKTGVSWFEAHYLAWDDDGNMVTPSSDYFSDWAYSDFEFWADAAVPPEPVAQSPQEGETP